jgi:hypothetical protein
MPKSLALGLLADKNKEIREIISMKTSAMESHIRARIVIPFCDKYDLSFTAGMGTWMFRDSHGKLFDLGVDRREHPDRPQDGSPEADDDRWYIEPTQEDKDIKEILDFQFDCMNCSIGSFMLDYNPRSPR